MQDWMLSIAKVIQASFSDIVEKIDIIQEKVRLTMNDGSYIDIIHPILNKFSYHWQTEKFIYRIDTAPHHREIETFPRHIHFQTEENVLPDNVLGASTIEENCTRFLNWIKSLMNS